MAMFDKKKNKGVDNTYFEGFGKTEPIQGGFQGGAGSPYPGGTLPTAGAGKTEALNQSPGNNYGNVPTTMGVNGGGLIDFDLNGGDKDKQVHVDDFGSTVTVGQLYTPGGTAVSLPVGWLVCTKGPDLGRSFQLYSGYNNIGRSSRVAITGDDQISGDHMCISYDSRNRAFFISRTGAKNAIYLNGAMLNGNEPLESYDRIETGQSAFVFVAFCGKEFSWEQEKGV